MKLRTFHLGVGRGGDEVFPLCPSSYFIPSVGSGAAMVSGRCPSSLARTGDLQGDGA